MENLRHHDFPEWDTRNAFPQLFTGTAVADPEALVDITDDFFSNDEGDTDGFETVVVGGTSFKSETNRLSENYPEDSLTLHLVFWKLLKRSASALIWRNCLPIFGAFVIIDVLRKNGTPLEVAGMGVALSVASVLNLSVVQTFSSALDTLSPLAIKRGNAQLCWKYLVKSIFLISWCFILTAPIFLYLFRLLTACGVDQGVAEAAGKVTIWLLPGFWALGFVEPVRRFVLHHGGRLSLLFDSLVGLLSIAATMRLLFRFRKVLLKSFSTHHFLSLQKSVGSEQVLDEMAVAALGYSVGVWAMLCTCASYLWWRRYEMGWQSGVKIFLYESTSRVGRRETTTRRRSNHTGKRRKKRKFHFDLQPAVFAKELRDQLLDPNFVYSEFATSDDEATENDENFHPLGAVSCAGHPSRGNPGKIAEIGDGAPDENDETCKHDAGEAGVTEAESPSPLKSELQKLGEEADSEGWVTEETDHLHRDSSEIMVFLPSCRRRRRPTSRPLTFDNGAIAGTTAEETFDPHSSTPPEIANSSSGNSAAGVLTTVAAGEIVKLEKSFSEAGTSSEGGETTTTAAGSTCRASAAVRGAPPGSSVTLNFSSQPCGPQTSQSTSQTLALSTPASRRSVPEMTKVGEISLPSVAADSSPAGSALRTAQPLKPGVLISHRRSTTAALSPPTSTNFLWHRKIPASTTSLLRAERALREVSQTPPTSSTTSAAYYSALTRPEIPALPIYEKFRTSAGQAPAACIGMRDGEPPPRMVIPILGAMTEGALLGSPRNSFMPGAHLTGDGGAGRSAGGRRGTSPDVRGTSGLLFQYEDVNVWEADFEAPIVAADDERKAYRGPFGESGSWRVVRSAKSMLGGLRSGHLPFSRSSSQLLDGDRLGQLARGGSSAEPVGGRSGRKQRRRSSRATVGWLRTGSSSMGSESLGAAAAEERGVAGERKVEECRKASSSAALDAGSYDYHCRHRQHREDSESGRQCSWSPITSFVASKVRNRHNAGENELGDTTGSVAHENSHANSCSGRQHDLQPQRHHSSASPLHSLFFARRQLRRASVSDAAASLPRRESGNLLGTSPSHFEHNSTSTASRSTKFDVLWSHKLSGISRVNHFANIHHQSSPAIPELVSQEQHGSGAQLVSANDPENSCEFGGTAETSSRRVDGVRSRGRQRRKSRKGRRPATAVVTKRSLSVQHFFGPLVLRQCCCPSTCDPRKWRQIKANFAQQAAETWAFSRVSLPGGATVVPSAIAIDIVLIGAATFLTETEIAALTCCRFIERLYNFLSFAWGLSANSIVKRNPSQGRTSSGIYRHLEARRTLQVALVGGVIGISILAFPLWSGSGAYYLVPEGNASSAIVPLCQSYGRIIALIAVLELVRSTCCEILRAVGEITFPLIWSGVLSHLLLTPASAFFLARYCKLGGEGVLLGAVVGYIANLIPLALKLREIEPFAF